MDAGAMQTDKGSRQHANEGAAGRAGIRRYRWGRGEGGGHFELRRKVGDGVGRFSGEM